MSAVYTPEAGDRVRITVEATISQVGANFIDTTANYFHTENVVSIEKWAGPEPVWARGDIIKVDPYIPAYRIGDDWLTVDGSPHRFSSNHDIPLNLSGFWAQGKVEILYKADA